MSGVFCCNYSILNLIGTFTVILLFSFSYFQLDAAFNAALSNDSKPELSLILTFYIDPNLSISN